jgi:hypothetical protein
VSSLFGSLYYVFAVHGGAATKSRIGDSYAHQNHSSVELSRRMKSDDRARGGFGVTEIFLFVDTPHNNSHKHLAHTHAPS